MLPRDGHESRAGPDVLKWYAGLVASVERVALCANLWLVHMGRSVRGERLSRDGASQLLHRDGWPAGMSTDVVLARSLASTVQDVVLDTSDEASAPGRPVSDICAESSSKPGNTAPELPPPSTDGEHLWPETALTASARSHGFHEGLRALSSGSPSVPRHATNTQKVWPSRSA
jgi:hypothetical protein